MEGNTNYAQAKANIAMADRASGEGTSAEVAATAASAAQAHATLALVDALEESMAKVVKGRELLPELEEPMMGTVARVEFSPGYGLTELRAELQELYEHLDDVRLANAHEIRTEAEGARDQVDTILSKVGRP